MTHQAPYDPYAYSRLRRSRVVRRQRSIALARLFVATSLGTFLAALTFAVLVQAGLL